MAFVNDNFKLATLTLTVAAAGSIGTAATTVDIASSFNVNYTGTADGVLTIPSPTSAIAGDVVSITNTGSVSFVLGSDSIAAGATTIAKWTGAAWAFFDGGRNAGAVVTVATIAAGNSLVTHNLAMPTGQFSNVTFEAVDANGSPVLFRRNTAADTANAIGISSPVAIATATRFFITPLA